eukprot:CAMPEP_0115270266 /NCGR_PEP_ID=MMETSP0270-20121206/53480_1 /TAXON_ID=71861 /ORGANISM="Scrippsiella trochoidea, Strain CCMP3099" /LENGTH=240 /DNA_ID=CAMNT_0002686559 /DNA_START=184 /DNA_END=907 /DNA_ORIENTATION=-
MHACECVRRLVQPSGTSWLDDRLLRGDNLPAERALLQDLGRATVAQHVAARDQARCHAFILAKAAIDSVVALDWHSNLDNACCLDWQSNWDRAFCIGSCCTMDCVGTTSARHTMEGLHIFCTGRRCTMVALDCANRLPFGADHKGPLWKSHVLNIHSREAKSRKLSSTSALTCIFSSSDMSWTRSLCSAEVLPSRPACVQANRTWLTISAAFAFLALLASRPTSAAKDIFCNMARGAQIW